MGMSEFRAPSGAHDQVSGASEFHSFLKGSEVAMLPSTQCNQVVFLECNFPVGWCLVPGGAASGR
jgi:hypothetical protein